MTILFLYILWNFLALLFGGAESLIDYLKTDWDRRYFTKSDHRIFTAIRTVLGVIISVLFFLHYYHTTTQVVVVEVLIAVVVFCLSLIGSFSLLHNGVYCVTKNYLHQQDYGCLLYKQGFWASANLSSTTTSPLERYFQYPYRLYYFIASTIAIILLIIKLSL